MAVNLEVSDGTIDLVDMGSMMIELTQTLALQDDASQRVKDNWNTICTWLKFDGTELGSSEKGKFGKSWKSYLAIGVAPSHKLQPAFDQFSEDCKVEGYDFEPDRPPDEVLAAFERMLATDEEINEKRALDVEQVRKRSSVDRPLKKGSLYRRRLLLIWAMLSIIWILGVINSHWNGLSPWLEDRDINGVYLSTEIVEKVEPDRRFGSIGPFKYRHPLPVKKLDIGTDELATARKFFPSFKDKSDDEFSKFLWLKVQATVTDIKIRRTKNAKNEAAEVALQGLIPALFALALVYLIIWVFGKYPPNQFSPYKKKTIVVGLIWILGVGTWGRFFGENFFYYDEYLLQFVFFPPVVIIIASMLWAWGCRPSSEKEI